MERLEQAIEILQRTRDGEDLAPHHLGLIQYVVNRGADPDVLVAFAELYANATKPAGYTRPWFHGIEHLTIDHVGYVRWRGRVVEHFSFSGPGAFERERGEAQRLAERCRDAERKAG